MMIVLAQCPLVPTKCRLGDSRGPQYFAGAGAVGYNSLDQMFRCTHYEPRVAHE